MRIFANLIAAGAAALFASSPLLAQGEVESEIEFAPDDDDAVPPSPSAAPAASPAASSQAPAAAPQAAADASAAPAADASAAPAADASAAPAADASAVPAAEGLITPRPPTNTRIFGKYRVRIAAARPQFDELEFYDELYGDEKAYPQFQADWFAWDWYATLGLSFRFAYYSAEGRAAKANKPKDQVVASDFEGEAPPARRDEAGPTTLTLVPLQLLAAAQFTPFDRKWIVVDAYAGLEYSYWQEVRTKAQSSTSATGTGGSTDTGGTGSSTAAAMLLAETEGDDDDGYTNTGFKTASVFGVGLNILLNGLDERSVASMRGSMGLGYVYLSPFLEVVRQLDGGASFSRSVIGVGFTFESLR
jgi:hypothetical protein